MAVEQMKYVSIVGPLSQFSSFVMKYVLSSNFQLEPSGKALTIEGLIPFEEDASNDLLQKRMRLLNDLIQVKVKKYDAEGINREILPDYNRDEIDRFVGAIEDRLDQHRGMIEKLKVEIQEREQIIHQIMPISNLDANVDDLFGLSFIKFRFGSMPKENYNKQRDYLDELDVIHTPVSEKDEMVWLSYFTPSEVAPVIDNVFSALGFQIIHISEQVEGLPKLAIEKLTGEIHVMKERINREESDLKLFLQSHKEIFAGYYNKVLYHGKISEIKALASHTKETFYLVGWIPAEDYKAFSKLADPLEGIIFSSEDPDDVENSMPPTVLKNKKFFKPFESIITMYGLPSPRELDPTIFLTITYVLMFGFMFGDVGQGAVIALFGAFMYFVRKINLGGVLLYVGVSSTIFGFVYGSVFGSEEILEPLWVSPLHGKDTINTILIVALVYGACIILFTIVASIINSIRMKRWGKLIFDKNGLAGLLFYGGIMVCVAISVLKGKVVFGALALIIVVIIPAILLVFKEPLENIMKRKEHIMPHEKGMYFVEAGFELFETILSFFSSTISFVRVGAFAINHAGLSLAVWTLYEMMHGGGGLVVVVFGNVLTIALEGLIVGIQCMRLEFYEMFGRFYLGEGYEFKPVKITDEKG